MDKEKRMLKFLEGDGFPIVSVKKGRNAKCECGSGKKQKSCCGDKPKFYSTKALSPEKKEKEDIDMIND